MIEIKEYTKNRIDDVLAFEHALHKEEDVWGWEIDDAYTNAVQDSFENPLFRASVSFLSYVDGKVVGRIDSSLIPSHFDGSVKAYLMSTE